MFLRVCWFLLKMYSFVFGSLLISSINLFVIGKILGLLFFSGWILTVLRFVSKSIHSIFDASPALAPVSLSIWRNAEVCLAVPAINWSISSSCGMNGILDSLLYFGFCHSKPLHLRKLV